MPLHIVFLELIIDPVCSVAFESEQEERKIMNRPPRNPNEQFFGRKKILFGIFQGCLILSVVLVVYFLSIKEGHTEGEVRAIAFSSFIVGNVALILVNLSKTRNFFSVITESNHTTVIILSTAVILLSLILFIPALQQLFSFQFPGYKHFIPSIIGAGVILFILETIKYFRYKKG